GAPRIGLSNVTRRQLAEALDLAPISAVEVALGAGDDEALRGGVVSLALELGLWVLAHSPFGGPQRAARLLRAPPLAPSVPARCLWLDVPLADAQRNVIERMLDAHGALVPPGDGPTRLAPHALFSQARRLEPPELDEGFTSIERVPFVRRPPPGRDGEGRA